MTMRIEAIQRLNHPVTSKEYRSFAGVVKFILSSFTETVKIVIYFDKESRSI